MKLPKLIQTIQAWPWPGFTRKPWFVAVALFVLLLALVAGGYQAFFHESAAEGGGSGAYIVIVSHDGEQQILPSRQPTVGTLLAHAGIHINKGDVVEPSIETRINQDDFRINVYRAKPVTVTSGNKRTFALSAAATPRSIAEQVGVKLGSEDEAEAEPVSNFIKQQALGEIVTIKRAVPVNLIVYGTPIVLDTAADTVDELLTEHQITLRPGDRVKPALNSPVTKNMKIFVLHKGTKIVTGTKTVPMPVEYVKDPKLSRGTLAIRQRGSPGKLLITYKVDKKGKKTKIQQVLINKPVKQIVAKGTAPVSSSLAVWLKKLRDCESGGNYQTNTGNGYYGAYQFSLATWHRIGYSGRPDQAPPDVQDRAIVRNTNLSSGGLASQNPGCYRSTGISAFPPGS